MTLYTAVHLPFINAVATGDCGCAEEQHLAIGPHSLTQAQGTLESLYCPPMSEFVPIFPLIKQCDLDGKLNASCLINGS